MPKVMSLLPSVVLKTAASGYIVGTRFLTGKSISVIEEFVGIKETVLLHQFRSLFSKCESNML